MVTGCIACGIAIPQMFANMPVNMGLVRSFLHRAEALGYESVWVQEQIVGDQTLLEPVTLLAYASALTSRVRLGTSVLLTTLRNPVQLAKSLSSLDQMSGGRLTVGVGVGGHVSEAIFGYTPDDRVQRFEEGLDVMTLLWTHSRATFRGRFWNFENVPMEPKPVQQPHPPLWFGALAPRALRRAVRYGRGWMGAGLSSSDDFVQQASMVRRCLEEEGKDPAGFTLSKRVYLALDENRGRSEIRLREWFGRRYKNGDAAVRVSVWGGIDECVDKLGALVRAGAQHLVLNPVFDEMEQVEALAQEIVPKIGR
jgi:probable F420-dependent oxidoreductase